MNEQQRHEMIFEQTNRSGAEEWHCPTCGRRVLVDWEPTFKKTVLEIGDEYAFHSGSRGGLRVGSVQVRQVDVSVREDEPLLRNEDFRMTPWLQWLEAVNFESLWDKES